MAIDPLLAIWEELGFPVFRPSDVEAWLRCPAYRAYKAQGVEPIAIAWSPAIILGTAIHAGLAAEYRRQRGDLDQPEPTEATLVSLRAGYADNVDWELGAVEKLALRGLQAALAVDVPGGRRILKVDEKLVVGHPDLILESPNKEMVIVDNKITMRLNPEWQVKRLAEFETANQWWHYAWEAQRTLGRTMQVVSGLVAHITVLTPRVRSFTHAWDAHPFHIEKWFRGAVRRWCEMERERRGLVEATWNLDGCNNKYGPCPYKMLDWDLRGDLTRAVEAGFYRIVPPGETTSSPEVS